MAVETNTSYPINKNSSKKIPHILIITTDAGGGHQSAVRSLTAGINELSDNGVTYTIEKLINIIGPLGKAVGVIFETFYNFGIQKGFYWVEPIVYFFLDGLPDAKYITKLPLKPLSNFLRKVKPDVLVSVMHGVTEGFLNAEKIVKPDKHVPIILVVTDPINIRKTWVSPLADLVIVATEEGKQFCLSYGVPEEKIKIVGLPLDPQFKNDDTEEEKEAIRAKYNIRKDLFTVLLMMGGPGSKNIHIFSNLINDSDLPVQVIACCGKDNLLKSIMDNIASKSKIPIIPLAYTTEIPVLMSVSDVLVTKPGPGTIVEAVVKDLPVIIDDTASYTMWQERGNVTYVEKNEIGKVIHKKEDLIPTIKELIENKELYNQIIKNMAKHKYMHATKSISEIIIDYCNKQVN